MAKPPTEHGADDPTVLLTRDGFAARVVVDHNTDLALLKLMLKALC